jgi:hypothetical protein
MQVVADGWDGGGGEWMAVELVVVTVIVGNG